MALQESDIEFQDIPIHIWEGGEGYPILVLPGSGAGASTIGNFGRVIEPLAKRYKILAADRIGFALSGRKSHEPFFDMDMWVDQADFLAQRLSKSGIGWCDWPETGGADPADSENADHGKSYTRKLVMG